VGFSSVHPAAVRDAGSYAARRARTGLGLPWLAADPDAQHVAAAVLHAVRRPRARLIVASRPIRPLLATQGLAPALAERAVEALGITRYFRRLAGST
jgi:hypothetical protein